MKSEESTRDKRYDRAEALRLLANTSHIYAARGKKVIHLDLKRNDPGEDELTKAIIGPSGYLRAPIARKGKSAVVGFDETTYSDLFR